MFEEDDVANVNRQKNAEYSEYWLPNYQFKVSATKRNVPIGKTEQKTNFSTVTFINECRPTMHGLDGWFRICALHRNSQPT